MVDTVSPEQRSNIMRSVSSKNTLPEKYIRSLLYSHGFRYRLYKSDLPGTPDIVMKKIKTTIFINGCFWHHHKNCKKSKIPSSNVSYWKSKITKNTIRDKSNYNSLKKMGWHVVLIWECKIKEFENSNTFNKLYKSYFKKS